MKGLAFIVLGLVLCAAAAALGQSALARGKPNDDPVPRAQLVGVNFVENCRYSHQAPDDPIVFPGQPGASHQHTFVGNRTTSAFSSSFWALFMASGLPVGVPNCFCSESICFCNPAAV